MKKWSPGLQFIGVVVVFIVDEQVFQNVACVFDPTGDARCVTSRSVLWRLPIKFSGVGLENVRMLDAMLFVIE